nr:FKBP-type peptidyl-prolyl cis-trans isomerase N-terminal domain-containing protein [Photobacterium damselae]
MVLAILLAVLVAFFLYRSYTNKQLAAENIKQGEAFLAENKTKPGVITTESGLQYLVLQPGTGTVH